MKRRTTPHDGDWICTTATSVAVDRAEMEQLTVEAETAAINFAAAFGPAKPAALARYKEAMRRLLKYLESSNCMSRGA